MFLIYFFGVWGVSAFQAFFKYIFSNIKCSVCVCVCVCVCVFKPSGGKDGSARGGDSGSENLPSPLEGRAHGFSLWGDCTGRNSAYETQDSSKTGEVTSRCNTIYAKQVEQSWAPSSAQERGMALSLSWAGRCRVY